MIVNNPAALRQGTAAQPHDPLPQFLLPGEVVLWQGRPRRGAGWRCMLRDRDAWLAAGAVLPLGVFFAVVQGRVSLTSLLAVPALAALALVVVFVKTGRQLARLHYVVTDRQAFSLGGPVNPWRMLSVKHGASLPRQRQSRCGTIIDLGDVVVGLGNAARWLRLDGSWLIRSGPDDRSPRLSFRALDPIDSPFDLLIRLARLAKAVRVGPVIPWPQGGLT